MYYHLSLVTAQWRYFKEIVIYPVLDINCGAPYGDTCKHSGIIVLNVK